MFTEIEKKILDATKPQYKYITRDGNGCLYLSVNRPSYYGKFLTSQSGLSSLNAFSHMFKGVKLGENPVCFRNPILDDIERDYLKSVLKPFHNKVDYVAKNYSALNKCYISARTFDSGILMLPTFDATKMYLSMESGRHYKLDELGITYDD